MAGVFLAACASLASLAMPVSVLVRNDTHAPITVESSPAGEQLSVAACSTVVLTLDQAGWRVTVDGQHAFASADFDASGIDHPERWVRIDVTSNDLVAELRVGQMPEPGVISACADA